MAVLLRHRKLNPTGLRTGHFICRDDQSTVHGWKHIGPGCGICGTKTKSHGRFVGCQSDWVPSWERIHIPSQPALLSRWFSELPVWWDMLASWMGRFFGRMISRSASQKLGLVFTAVRLRFRERMSTTFLLLKEGQEREQPGFYNDKHHPDWSLRFGFYLCSLHVWLSS